MIDKNEIKYLAVTYSQYTLTKEQLKTFPQNEPLIVSAWVWTYALRNTQKKLDIVIVRNSDLEADLAYLNALIKQNDTGSEHEG